ncbi:MAG: fuconate dehydratase, partial [Chloroflexi bacterium]
MSGSTITSLEALDVRFPTSRTLAGSDAMNTAPDYSATYVILRTDRGDRLSGHGLTFTTGRGNEVVLAAANALRPLIVGKTIET